MPRTAARAVQILFFQFSAMDADYISANYFKDTEFDKFASDGRSNCLKVTLMAIFCTLLTFFWFGMTFVVQTRVNTAYWALILVFVLFGCYLAQEQYFRLIFVPSDRQYLRFHFFVFIYFCSHHAV